MSRDYLKSKKHQDSHNRGKSIKYSKNQAEEYLPLAIRPEKISTETKQLIFEL